MEVNEPRLRRLAESNPILGTLLAPRIGYDKAADIVKQALAEGRTIAQVADDKTYMNEEQLDDLLDPLRATGPDR